MFDHEYTTDERWTECPHCKGSGGFSVNAGGHWGSVGCVCCGGHVPNKDMPKGKDEKFFAVEITKTVRRLAVVAATDADAALNAVRVDSDESIETVRGFREFPDPFKEVRPVETLNRLECPACEETFVRWDKRDAEDGEWQAVRRDEGRPSDESCLCDDCFEQIAEVRAAAV